MPSGTSASLPSQGSNKSPIPHTNVYLPRVSVDFTSLLRVTPASWGVALFQKGTTTDLFTFHFLQQKFPFFWLRMLLSKYVRRCHVSCFSSSSPDSSSSSCLLYLNISSIVFMNMRELQELKTTLFYYPKVIVNLEVKDKFAFCFRIVGLLHSSREKEASNT